MQGLDRHLFGTARRCWSAAAFQPFTMVERSRGLTLAAVNRTVHHDARCGRTTHFGRDAVTTRPRISISLPEQHYTALCALAEQHKISLAWLGRQAVAEFLERYRDRDLQLPLTLPSARLSR